MSIQEFENIWNDAAWTYLSSGFSPREGFTARYPEKSLLLSKYAAMLPRDSRVIEIGFNMGHGAFSILKNGKNIIEFISFDICYHDYVSVIWEKFKIIFQKFKTVQGDTLDTLVEFSKKNPSSFDLIHVDGGHTYEIAKSDINCALSLAKSGAIIILDDFNIPEIRKAFEEIDKSLFQEIEEMRTISGGSLSDVGFNRHSISKVIRRS